MEGFVVTCPLAPDVPSFAQATEGQPHASQRPGVALAKTGFRPRLALARRSASARRHGDAPGSGPGQALLSRRSFQRRRLPSDSTYVNDINHEQDSRTGDFLPRHSLRLGPSILLRINSLGVGTFTPQVPCHARQTTPITRGPIFSPVWFMGLLCE
jgi:hypothetical protein